MVWRLTGNDDIHGRNVVLYVKGYGRLGENSTRTCPWQVRCQIHVASFNIYDANLVLYSQKRIFMSWTCTALKGRI